VRDECIRAAVQTGPGDEPGAQRVEVGVVPEGHTHAVEAVLVELAACRRCVVAVVADTIVWKLADGVDTPEERDVGAVPTVPDVLQARRDAGGVNPAVGERLQTGETLSVEVEAVEAAGGVGVEVVRRGRGSEGGGCGEGGVGTEG